jgi:hypothetical protein
MIARSYYVLSAIMVLAVLAVVPGANAFSPRPALQRSAVSSTTTSLNIFGKKKEDFSDIETRDMTREEMGELNQKNTDIMNAELWGMTAFSLVISIPMLYLVWVGFFSETAGDIDLTDSMPY